MANALGWRVEVSGLSLPTPTTTNPGLQVRSPIIVHESTHPHHHQPGTAGAFTKKCTQRSTEEDVWWGRWKPGCCNLNDPPSGQAGSSYRHVQSAVVIVLQGHAGRMQYEMCTIYQISEPFSLGYQKPGSIHMFGKKP